MPKSAGGSGKDRKPAAEPRLGIFWLLGKRLLFDMSALSEAESYGDFKIHYGNHVTVWERFRSQKLVPPEVEYEEPPRGRVTFNTKTRQFSLLADKCILSRKDLIATIKNELHLPKQISLGTDPHYRCFTCLHGAADDEED